MKIVVTGANGFVGGALASHLHSSSSHQVVGVMRRPLKTDFPSQLIFDTSDDAGWRQLLESADVVIHCAAIAHRPDISLSALHTANVVLPAKIARLAQESGCSKFIFLSTVGIHGSATHGNAFCEQDIPNPNGVYAESKLQAERLLQDISDRTGLPLVVVRSPLVYGKNAPGNFGALALWISQGKPLPFGCLTENRRSYIGIDNLTSFLTVCAEQPMSSGETFLVRDSEEISTAELVARISHAFGRRANLWNVPSPLLKLGAQIFGKQTSMSRILDDFQIDSSKAQRLMGWRPAFTMNQQLQQLSRGA